MFKRRLAVLGAAAVLAITGLAGSAMADQTPAPAGTKVTCTTSDGKTIEIAEALPARKGEPVPGAGIAVRKTADGVEVTAIPAGEMEGEWHKTTKPLPADAESVESVPALPAKPGETVELPTLDAPVKGDPAKTVRIICEKPE
ncbi:hypothetical protein SAMN05444920_104494 [Nonomuraea solani]|uniref:Uncharacterized protein n=1 Tax=Nonomuraea solani TaxID=1144553 RepID=A0A1H6CYK7_9ACTN|nr:hypothetical protein [Nonomuraea solani]SEG77456.1 hypothetical protein SAMN05444920_104494 [Nonomuraea solani]